MAIAALALLLAGCGSSTGSDSTASTNTSTADSGQPNSSNPERSSAKSKASTGQAAQIVVLPRDVPADGFSAPQRRWLERHGFTTVQIERLEAEANQLTEKSAKHHTSPVQHHDTPTGAAAFRTKGGDNSIQESGSEAGSSEFDQAAAALHGYLDARVARDWPTACFYMSPAIVRSLGQLTSKTDVNCPKALATLSTGIPDAALRDSAIAEVGALRVSGPSAFILFHGAHDTDYFMPMAQEGDAWKVAALAPSPLQ